MLAATFASRSGQSRSITRSRWRRWPGARASSLVRLAALRCRHLPPSMSRDPTRTRKSPSSQTRTVSIPRPEASRIATHHRSRWEDASFPPSRVPASRIPSLVTLAYKIGAWGSESAMKPHANQPRPFGRPCSRMTGAVAARYASRPQNLGIVLDVAYRGTSIRAPSAALRSARGADRLGRSTVRFSRRAETSATLRVASSCSPSGARTR